MGVELVAAFFLLVGVSPTSCWTKLGVTLSDAWNFYIVGYQPAQKWLKDRKGRTLAFDDILHYQKIIVALKVTSELMVEIDKVMEV